MYTYVHVYPGSNSTLHTKIKNMHFEALMQSVLEMQIRSVIEYVVVGIECPSGKNNSIYG